MHSDPDPSCPSHLCPQDLSKKTAATTSPSSTVLFSAGTTTPLPPFPSTSTAVTSTTDTTPAPHTTSSFSTTAAPSHKRGRESSAMTDPSEAARYTPPREMFKHSGTTPDSDDLLLSEDGLQEGETENQNDNASYKEDSEIDSLGQQLSINSPEKTSIVTVDNEQGQADRVPIASDIETVQQHARTPLQKSNNSAENDSKESELEEQNIQGQSATHSFQQQSEIIQNLRFRRLEEGDPWYLINKTWFTNFRKYCLRMASGGEAEHPGPIDNSILFSGNNLKQDVQMSVISLPQEAWDFLVLWYGSSTPPIMRRVVNTGSESAPNLMIDYYPPVFTLYKVVDSNQAENPLFATNEPDTLEVPRSTKFGDLKSALINRLELSTLEPSRLWTIPTFANANFSGNVIGVLDLSLAMATCLEHVSDDTPIAEVPELVRGANIVLEVAVDGSFPVPFTTPVRTFESNMVSSYPHIYPNSRTNNFSSPSPQGPPVDGICGLSNLGNTCFMNSALQCLSNSSDLTRYILAGAWRDELNLDNPLGMGGEVARAYANLIDKLWKGSNKMFSPREFKSTIGRFAPSFTGYHQHDSQELLAFLLDGLHEDLNRIKKKPYTEVPDSNGRPDEEVASDCWQIHKARNDSIIVDLFQGQYKSTLVCPKCDKISVTFDPFMYLSLPLPINKKWVGTITYVPYDPKKPVVDIRLQLPKGSSQKQLKEKIAELMGTQASHLFSAEVFSNRLYKSHDNADPVDEMSETDKNFVYEVPVPDFTNSPDHVVFPVHNMVEPISSYGRASSFGHPIMVCVTKEDALDPDAVYTAIVKQLSRYTTFNLYEGETESSEQEQEQEIETADKDVDVNMSSSDEITEDKLPKSGLFRLMVYSPPTPHPSRYQLRIPRSTMFAPSAPPSISDMVDMVQRVAPQEPEVDQEMESFKTPNHFNRSSNDNDDDDSDALPNPGSPSDLLSSTPPFNQPRIPKPSDDELSEEDDPATLPSSSGAKARFSSRRHESPPTPVRVAEPAVRQGEMVYCVWARSLESVISAPERRYQGYSNYRSMDEDEEQDSGVRVLWDHRGPKVIDPALEEELSMGGKPKKVITLEDCLNEYTREEQLGEEDLWYCPTCKEHQQATKKLDIWRLPDVLVVHLKRFSHTRAWRDKIDAMIDFPIHGLDLSAKTLKEEDRQENVYDLFGVSNHMGGMGGGHYTAYAKNEKLNQWFNFDDSHVSPVHNVESIKSSSAYLLFYRRRNAAVREYAQRTVEEPEPVMSSVPQFHSGFMEATTSTSITLRDKDEDEERDGWGKPIVPFTDIDCRFDDELPTYSSTIGPSGIASPPSSYSGRSAYMSEKRYGKGRSMDEGGDDFDNDSSMNANMTDYPSSHVDQDTHSPDLSTYASGGSSPGTANVSPNFSPPALSSSVVDLTQSEDLASIGPSYMSSISREGGRIDDSVGVIDEGEGTVMSYPYRELGAGAGISTPGSTMSGVEMETPEVGENTEGEESEQDEVNMVVWQSSPANN